MSILELSGKPNSELIEQEFGSFGIEVLAQSSAIRVSRLYSSAGEASATRTLAVVLFNPALSGEIATEHAAIKGGAPIGETFKKAGWTVTKQNMRIENIHRSELHAHLQELIGTITHGDMALHFYRLLVRKAGHSLEYATIAEIHDPSYLSVADVQAIYSELEWVQPGPAQMNALNLALAEGKW